MTDEEKDPEPAEAGIFALNRILVDPTAAPVVAHHIMWTRIAREYTLELGHYDPVAVREAIKKGAKTLEEAIGVDFFVTHRFSVSLETMERFAEGLEQLRTDIERAKQASHSMRTTTKDDDDQPKAES